MSAVRGDPLPRRLSGLGHESELPAVPTGGRGGDRSVNLAPRCVAAEDEPCTLICVTFIADSIVPDRDLNWTAALSLVKAAIFSSSVSMQVT